MSMTESDLSISDTDASARRMAAERAACRPFTTAALESGGLAELREAAGDLIVALAVQDHRPDWLVEMMGPVRAALAKLEARP